MGEGEHLRLGRLLAVATASLLRDAWLEEVTREDSTPLPWLRGAAFETRTPIAELCHG